MMFRTGSVLPVVTGSTEALRTRTGLGLGGSAALGPWTCGTLSVLLLLLPAKAILAVVTSVQRDIIANTQLVV